jgi:uncharacterized membrane protein (UPF0127 family)
MALSVHSRGRRLLLRVAILIFVAWLVAAISRQAFGQLALTAAPPTVELVVRGKPLHAELADTPERRARGLMYRTDLTADQGMLFVFDQADRHCMWMRNTPLPLSVAFLDASGRITNVADMTPFSDTAHCATQPALFAIETRQGWFSRHGVVRGDRVGGLPARP